MTCWAGFSAPDTSAPRARSLTAPMNAFTTGSATSASSSATRISRAVASMSASDSLPLPRRDVKTLSRRSERVSNIGPRYVGGGRPRLVGGQPTPAGPGVRPLFTWCQQGSPMLTAKHSSTAHPDTERHLMRRALPLALAMTAIALLALVGAAPSSAAGPDPKQLGTLGIGHVFVVNIENKSFDEAYVS